MGEPPKVSVIIPVFNSEKYLKQCLDSLVHQTLTDIEIICVDDGSTDSSLEILNGYAELDPRFTIFHQNNQYAGTARNRGLDIARGKYVYFMDSDDYCDLELLKCTTQYADKFDAEIVAFDYYRFDNSSEEKEYRYGLVKKRLPKLQGVFSYEDVPDEICSLINPTPWNKIFLREFLLKNGLRYLELQTTNDITFATLSVIMATKITYVEKSLLYYRTNLHGSVSSKKKEHLDDIITAVLSVDQQAKKLLYYQLIKNSIRKFIVRNLFLALERYAGDEDEVSYVDFSIKIDAILYGYPLFIDVKETDICDKRVFNHIMECKKRATNRNDNSFCPKVIVSLTSFPARIDKVHLAIRSLVLQTRKPDMIILWLAKTQFPNGEEDLPDKLLNYKKLGLTIEWCEDDLRPHKKYFYAMQKYPYDVVVTVDDDLIYEVNMIELLFQSYLQFPYAVSCMRTHLITENNSGHIAEYSEWIKEYSGIVNTPSFRLFATSGAGTLYPPFCMNSNLFNMNDIKTLCINADDLWLKIMQVLNNTPVVLVRPNKRLNYIEGTQDIALREDNLNAKGNDHQLENILRKYDTSTEEGKSRIAQIIFSSSFIKNTESIEQKKKIEDIKPNAILLRRLEWADKEIELIHNSWTYRIGRFITFIPRKIRGGIRCYKENGMQYTLNRAKAKFRRLVRR